MWDIVIIFFLLVQSGFCRPKDDVTRSRGNNNKYQVLEKKSNEGEDGDLNKSTQDIIDGITLVDKAKCTILEEKDNDIDDIDDYDSIDDNVFYDPHGNSIGLHQVPNAMSLLDGLSGMVGIGGMAAPQNGFKFIYDEQTGMGFRETSFEVDDQQSMVIKRIEQSYGTVKIDGAQLVEHEYFGLELWLMDKQTLKKTRKVKHPIKKKRVGTIAYNLPKDIDIKTFDPTAYDPSEAMSKFMELRGKPENSTRDHTQEVMFSYQYSDQLQLIYRVSFLKVGTSVTIPTAIYNASSLELIEEWDNMAGLVVPQGTGPGGNLNIGKLVYGKTMKNLVVNHLGNGTCTYSTENVTIVDLKHAMDPDTVNNSFSYTCYNQNNDQYNGGYSALNDALYNAQLVYDFFTHSYNRRPMKDGTIIKVHYGKNEPTANFYPSQRATYIFIGDGTDEQYPLTTLPLIAHEIAHGLTHETSKLEPEIPVQSGALNEFFSDATAMAVQRFVYGSNEKVEWKIGKDVFRDKNRQFRCMDDPSCPGINWQGGISGPSGIDHVKYLKQWGQGPYEIGGIWRKVFYLLSKKYDIWDVYDVFYVANTKFWQSKTDFRQAAELLLRAVVEMKEGLHLPWEYKHFEIKDIIDAFKEVGIDCLLRKNKYKCRI